MHAPTGLVLRIVGAGRVEALGVAALLDTSEWVVGAPGSPSAVVLCGPLEGMADPLRVDFLESLNGDVPWVAVVACRRSDRAWEALQLGAGGVAWEDESAAAISERVARAIGGGVFLPPRLGRMPDSQASGLSVDERSLLERLAAPASIGEIAKAVGYSERHLHRLCRSLYTRLDISGRHEVAALLRATRFADPEATPSMQPLESL